MSKKAEHWLNKHWRPAMAWMYFVVCIADFIIFPILWSVAKMKTGAELERWLPITLEGAGLFHLAMGAILGVAAWSRGQEKIAGMNMYNYGSAYDRMGDGYEYTTQTPISPPISPKIPDEDQ